MDRMMVAVQWKAPCGDRLWDATTLARLSDTIHTIRKERGRVLAVRWLEVLKSE